MDIYLCIYMYTYKTSLQLIRSFRGDGEEVKRETDRDREREREREKGRQREREI